MQRSGENFAALIVIIAVILLLYYWAPWNNNLPDLSKPVFLSGTHNNPPNPPENIKGTLNNDKTGSITNETGNNYTEQGTWQIISQNDEMIKINFKTNSNYMITLYKKNRASIAGGTFQINGHWRQ